MAVKFQKSKNTGLLELQFGDIVYKVDVLTPEYAKKLIEVGEKYSGKKKFTESNSKELKDELSGVVEFILGEGSYSQICKDVYDKEELTIPELFEVILFISDEMTSKTNEINKVTNLYSNRLNGLEN
ncbi:hypothetical protein WKS98_08290 [Lagierella sp. ICN-221743]